mmetsp:Transcript_63792/g.125244  ORF Transcript_63792/g.125244 Transcript_63792/m.125244 type:complete len:322 (+) Transcript_63792:162-1127(+)
MQKTSNNAEEARREFKPRAVKVAMQKTFDAPTLLAGSFAGVVGTLLGYPLDTIKSHMASQASRSSQSMIRSTRQIFCQHGARGFYNGVSSPLVSLVILNTIGFSTFTYFCRVLKVEPHSPHFIREAVSMRIEPRYVVAGSLTGVLASFVSTPFELLKVQMQLHQKHFNGIFDTAKKITKKKGVVRGLYTGHSINVVREILFGGAYFGIYEHGKQALLGTLVPSLAVPIAGGCAGALAWTVSYPLDLIKTQIQGQRLVFDPGNNGSHPTTGALSVARQLVQTRGGRGLFVGLGPSVTRAFLVSGSRFSAFEFALSHLSGSRD